MRAMTMTPHDVISRINKYQHDIVFPRMFERVHFDMVAEVDYHFVVVNISRKKKTTKRIVMTHASFWMTHDRNPQGGFQVQFETEEGKHMGRWMHNIVDPTAGNCGIIGFSANPSTLPDALAEPGCFAVVSEKGRLYTGGVITPVV